MLYILWRKTWGYVFHEAKLVNSSRRAAMQLSYIRLRLVHRLENAKNEKKSHEIQQTYFTYKCQHDTSSVTNNCAQIALECLITIGVSYFFSYTVTNGVAFKNKQFTSCKSRDKTCKTQHMRCDTSDPFQIQSVEKGNWKR